MVKSIQTSNIAANTTLPLSPSDKGNSEVTTSLNITSNQAKDEILKLYNLTEEQLNEILKQYPDFYSLTPEIQAKKVDEIKNKIVKAPEALDDQAANVKLEGASNEEPVSTTQKFNNKVLDSSSNSELIDIYALESAKNKFMYADSDNKKILDDWNKLSDTERQKLVDAEKQAYKASVKAKFLDENEANKSLQYTITSIQAANKRGVALGQLNKDGLLAKAEAAHEYIFELDDSDRSAGQKRYIDEQQELSKALVEYCRKRGEDWGNGEYILSPEEIQQHCKRLGVNISEVKLEYYNQLKQDNLNLTEAQQKDFDKLSKMSDFLKAVKEQPVKDYGRLTALKNDEKFGSAYMAEGNSIDDKLTIIKKYIKTEYNNLPDDKRRTAILELASELVQQDPELATLFHEYVVGDADDAGQKNIIKSDVGLTKELNAYNVNSFAAENSVLLAQDQKDMVAKDPKRAEALALIAQGAQVDEEHLSATSSVYSGFGIESVEQKHAENAYDKTRVSANTQLKMLSNVYENSCDEVAKYAGTHTDKAYAENQLDLTKKASKRKVVNNAMIEDGTFNRYSKENIVPAFNIHKERCQESDYSHEEAVNSLNLLSDQIQNCKYADKQLEMHNSMMDLDQNLYSEVIEHVAGNIKNYDSSIQSAALDSVYASGNQRAIEIAVADIPNYKSSDVQNLEYQRAICEIAVQNSKEEKFLEKFLTGGLSYQEIAQLTPAQRNQYYAEIFKKASPSEKIALISKLPNGAQKRSIYTMIALYDSNLLTSMVERGMGLEMFNACNDIKAQNKIFSTMKRSENQTVKEQCEKIKSDPRNAGLFIGESLPKNKYSNSEKTSYGYSGMIIPEGFNVKEILPRDKYGNLIV